MADIQESDPAGKVRDSVETISTSDSEVRRLQELQYLQQYATMMSALDPSRGFEIR